MMAMTATQPARIHVVAVIVATIAALVGRSWLQLKLLANGVQQDYAADLSYLAVPPILLTLLLPVLHKDRAFIGQQFRLTGLSLGTVFVAIAIGVLARAMWWSQLFAGISFGIYRNSDPSAIAGPTFTINCPAPVVVALGFLVMAIMVPIIEEVTHRAYVQTAFRHRGPIVAICLSALVFAILHRFSGWPFAFFAGLIFGVQYWRSGTLWPSVISHATVNALVQVDWRCVRGHWNPPPIQLPLWNIGLPSLLILAVTVLAIIYLLFGKKPGRWMRPGNDRITERLRPSR